MVRTDDLSIALEVFVSINDWQFSPRLKVRKRPGIECQHVVDVVLLMV